MGIIALVRWPRFVLAVPLSLVLLACGDDGGQAVETGSDATGDPATSAPTTTVDPDDSGGCVLGQNDCGCLDGGCIAGNYCVDDVCVQGPQVSVDESRAVVGGVVVRVEGEATADEVAWEQISGPPVELVGADTLAVALAVPADATPGEQIVLRLSATRNGVTLTADTSISVLEALFHDALPMISDPAQLGTTEGLDFGNTGMWVVSTEGFVSRFDDDGNFVERIDVPGAPVGANFSGEQLVIANREGTGRVQAINEVSGTLATLFDALGGGEPLGEVNLPLPDTDGNVFVSTRLGQTVLRYDQEAGTASSFLQSASVQNPNALAFGPENTAIYVGAQGHVWRVPLLEGGMAGEPEDYLVLGDDSDITYEVDGLVFDEGQNLWIGCPNASTLFVAHHSVDGPAEVSRSFTDVGPGISRFVNLHFGRGEFPGDTLYYTNLSDGTVGRVRVGLQELDAPLAD